MAKRITRAEAKSFKRQWEMVNAAEIEDLRSMPVSRKFQKLSWLMLAAKQLKRTKKSTKEESEVWERWNRIRRAFHD